jgi:hypothetical protein
MYWCIIFQRWERDLWLAGCFMNCFVIGRHHVQDGLCEDTTHGSGNDVILIDHLRSVEQASFPSFLHWGNSICVHNSKISMWLDKYWIATVTQRKAWGRFFMLISDWSVYSAWSLIGTVTAEDQLCVTVLVCMFFYRICTHNVDYTVVYVYNLREFHQFFF